MTAGFHGAEGSVVVATVPALEPVAAHSVAVGQDTVRPSVPCVSVQAAASPVGLLVVPMRLPSSSSTHDVTDAQSTSYRKLPLSSVFFHAALPPVGLVVDVTKLPPTATHRFTD